MSGRVMALLLFSLLLSGSGPVMWYFGQQALMAAPQAPLVWKLPEVPQNEALKQEIAALEAEVSSLVPSEAPFITISISDRRLEYHEAGSVRRMPAAVGMGRSFVNGKQVFFDTPLGRFSITVKEENPIWQAPDWHYHEVAQKNKTKAISLTSTSRVTLSDGRVVGVEDKQIGTYDSAGVFTPIPGGSDVVLDGKVFMPPWGSPNRFYPEILGTRRLKLTAEYAIHGTNKPSSVGRASSHGCIRLTNPDIEALYKEVRVGTPVFIY